MIAPTVLSLHGPILPINVCAHCGDADSPEDTRNWPEDDDGHRICPPCAETTPGTATLEPHRDHPTIPVPGPTPTDVRENLISQYLETIRREQELRARLAEVGISADAVSIGGGR